jgi:hypothetical protein
MDDSKRLFGVNTIWQSRNFNYLLIPTFNQDKTRSDKIERKVFAIFTKARVHHRT